jgi:hypothetical protein
MQDRKPCRIGTESFFSIKNPAGSGIFMGAHKYLFNPPTQADK